MTESRIIRSALPTEGLPSLVKQELAYEKQLIAEGKLLMAYSRVGGRGSFMLWDVESNDEMNKILAGFPMFKYLEYTVTPVVLHTCFRDSK